MLPDEIIEAILNNDRHSVSMLLRENKSLALEHFDGDRYFETKIFHWIYTGDTLLHLASAGYRTTIIKNLISAGADVNSNRNRRRGTPLHYAADGYINGKDWNPQHQVAAIKCLIEAGAGINMQDLNGATALHRAVRTRCADAVVYLIQAGAEATLPNKSGSTAFHLAVQNTGRGGTGSKNSKIAQQQIIEFLLASNVSILLKDHAGKSVLDLAHEEWIRKLLSQ